MWFVVLSAARAEAGVTLTVTVEGLRSDTGTVGCTLFRAADGFPDDDTLAAARQVAVPKDGRATCTFVGVEPGRVAVALLHDEDGDLKLDRSFVGKPTEGYGFSNGARASMFSAPTFDAAAFLVSADLGVTLPVVY